MNEKNGPPILAILIITVGVGWLLTIKNVVPGINWIWTLGLLMAGILAFVISKGIDKFSVLAGPFFVVASILSTLRQTGRLSLDTEVPILVIVVGVLMLLAHSSLVPLPNWAIADAKDGKRAN
jgi:hypothetical protein